MAVLRSVRRLLLLVGVGVGRVALAAPVVFDLPAQPASTALLAFSRQAGVEVLYSHDDLRPITANAVTGSLEPEDALNRLLRNSGFGARRTAPGKFVITRAARPTGAIAGRLLARDGTPARGAQVALAGTRQRAEADEDGHFLLPRVPPGEYRLFAGGRGFRPIERAGVNVEANQTHTLEALTLVAATEITELEPYLVKDRDDRLPIGEGVGAAPRRAAGNLDLPRTEDNALPFTVFTREQIARSGVVQLNEFFQRELLDGNATLPPEQSGKEDSFVSGSSNIGLRGYGSDQTVVLVNGRRLPESFTAMTGALGAPDVNLVPLSLVQQVEVLPVSASALYNGNAVGGVINIVLRPDAEGTELHTTYTNALGGFDAPQSSVSLQHGQKLLGGALKLRLSLTLTRTDPAVESELGLQRRRLAATVGLASRATPNVRSSDGSGLFGPGTANFTSVAPGASGSDGLAAFIEREGQLNTAAFDTPEGLAASFDSVDYPYGRRQRRTMWYGSAVYDVRPWLQLGLDATYARTEIHRGHELFPAELTLAGSSPLNPFGRDVTVALYDYAPRLGADYNQARLDSYGLVAGALIKLPADWQLAFDGQYSRSRARYRGVVRADATRWQELVDAGNYQPLRDTQVFAPPDEFYDRVLVYYDGPGRFATLGDYTTFEGAVRLTHEALALPTGSSTVNLGGDYRLNELAPYTEQPRFADGTPAPEIVEWSGRTLERLSVFGEIQAPLLPSRWLPRGVKAVETDTAVRYIVSAQSNETSLAPTFGLKVNFAGGLAFRGSVTTSNRFPSTLMSRRLGEGAGSGAGSDPAPIIDPRRDGEQYVIESKIAINPDVRPEEAVTQTAGLIWQRGRDHRFRASLDFADTTKTNEIIGLEAQDVINLETIFPDRVRRDSPVTSGPPRITTVLTGTVNAARRHSQNWSLAADYAWRGFAGGTLDLHGRWVWFQRYDRQLAPGGPTIDVLNRPDITSNGLLRHRVTFGAGWSNSRFGFGLDHHYFGARTIPEPERAAQGSNQIKPYLQVDAHARVDLTSWLPRRPRNDRFRLGVQGRVNNLTDFDFPKYVSDPSATGRQPYGDWRGRTYSLSLTAEF